MNFLLKRVFKKHHRNTDENTWAYCAVDQDCQVRNTRNSQIVGSDLLVVGIIRLPIWSIWIANVDCQCGLPMWIADLDRWSSKNWANRQSNKKWTATLALAIEGAIANRYYTWPETRCVFSFPFVLLNSLAMFNSRRPPNGKRVPRKRARLRTKIKKRDPLLVEGKRPRPMYVDYKDIELLTKLVNRHGRIVSRRKSGCSAASQHAVSQAVKRARFMALMPYVGE